MYVPCWNCGTEAWVETQVECRDCRAVVRRCEDCVNLRRGDFSCSVFGVEITDLDRLKPTSLSLSYKCSHYKTSPEAMTKLKQHASEVAGKAAGPATPTSSTAAPRPAAAPAPAELPPQPKVTPQPAAQPRRKQPIIIGHRGASALAPENTLAAVRHAVESGAQAVEVDVLISHDGKPVCIHDATLQRTTNGSGWVADLTVRELKDLDAGSWFSDEFKGERIPTLDQVLVAVHAPTRVNVHLRAHENESDRCEVAVVDAILAANAVSRTWVTHHTRHGLHRIKSLSPELRLCWVSPGGESDAEYVDDAYYMGFHMLQPPIHSVTESFVHYAHEREMWVNVSYARTEEDITHLVGLGVDGIFVADPGMMRDLLHTHEAQS